MTRTRHSAPSEAPPRGPERLRCPDSYRSMRLEAIDVPRWRSSRWCGVLGRKGVTGVVNAGRPSLSSPSCCQLSDPGRVGDLTRPSLDYEVELGGGDTERASLVASEVPALACRLAGLEPKCAINPKPADTGDVWTSIAIDRGQPTSVPVRAARPWRLRDAPVEACFDAAPVEERRSADVVEIRCFHDRSDATDHRMSTAIEK